MLVRVRDESRPSIQPNDLLRRGKIARGIAKFHMAPREVSGHRGAAQSGHRWVIRLPAEEVLRETCLIQSGASSPGDHQPSQSFKRLSTLSCRGMSAKRRRKSADSTMNHRLDALGAFSRAKYVATGRSCFRFGNVGGGAAAEPAMLLTSLILPTHRISLLLESYYNQHITLTESSNFGT